MRSFLCLLVFCLASCSSNPSGLADASDEGFFTSGDIQLHYVLDFPDDGPGPYPTIVLGHGSGPKTIRDLEAFAKRMLNLGFAVLRYDKRGTGDSGGRFVPSNTTEVNTAIPKYYAPDMAAAVRFVAGHQKVDRERIGLLGESQAGWVIPPAAVEAGNAAFVIILSGPVTPLGNVGAYERYANEHRYPEILCAGHGGGRPVCGRPSKSRSRANWPTGGEPGRLGYSARGGRGWKRGLRYHPVWPP